MSRTKENRMGPDRREDIDLLAASLAVAHTAYIERIPPSDNYEAEVFENCLDICREETAADLAKALNWGIADGSISDSERRALVAWMDAGCPA